LVLLDTFALSIISALFNVLCLIYALAFSNGMALFDVHSIFNASILFIFFSPSRRPICSRRLGSFHFFRPSRRLIFCRRLGAFYLLSFTRHSISYPYLSLSSAMALFAVISLQSPVQTTPSIHTINSHHSIHPFGRTFLLTCSEGSNIHDPCHRNN
jgi:hypothetical protein